MAQVAYVSASPLTTPERLIYTLKDGVMIESGMEWTATGGVCQLFPSMMSVVADKEDTRVTRVKALSRIMYRHELTEDDMDIMELEDCDFLDRPETSLRNLMNTLIRVDSFGDRFEASIYGDSDDDDDEEQYFTAFDDEDPAGEEDDDDDDFVIEEACATPIISQVPSLVTIPKLADPLGVSIPTDGRPSRKRSWFRRAASKMSKALFSRSRMA